MKNNNRNSDAPASGRLKAGQSYTNLTQIMLVNDSLPPEESRSSSLSSEIEQLKTLIYTDDLTGLYNRRFFRQCIDELKSQSDSTRSPFAVLMMDVDRFKEINDAHGHAVGDAALILIAKTLKEELQNLGWVFRYAGDEFVALIRNADETQAREISSRVLIRISEIRDPDVPKLTLSIGIGIYPATSQTISELLSLADRALYMSKRRGRSTIHSAREALDVDPSHSSRWPATVHCGSMIGREYAWRILQTQLTECKNGHGCVVTLSGQAGIGKTRLLREFSQRQRTGDYHILLGECSEGTIIHSYAPVRDALNKGFEAKDSATVNIYRELEVHYRRELIALVPQFDRFEKEQIESRISNDPYFLLEAILLLLKGMSRQLATILILEDIHWGDEATLNLLQFLARNISNERILIIATLRTEEAIDSSLPAVLSNLRRLDLYSNVEVTPLSSEETGKMVSAVFAGYSVPPSVKEWIFHETEGIPFYVEELIKHLTEEGHLQRYGSEIGLAKQDKTMLPASIKALILRRVSRLTEMHQRVLGFASLIGYQFDFNTLVKLIEENEGFLLDLLEQLERLQLIREVPLEGEELFQFSHNKIRDVIYEEMGLIKRRKFHARVGEILESLHKENIELYCEDLAYHFDRAGNTAKAGNYSLLAGKKSLQIHAYQDALKHFDRCEQCFEAEFDPSDSSHAENFAQLAIYRGFALEALGLSDRAIESYGRLLRLHSAKKNYEADALNYLSRVYYHRADFSQSLSLAEEALDSSREIGDKTAVATALFNLAKNYWRICKYEEALASINAAVISASEIGDFGLTGKSLNMKAILLIEQGNYAEAKRDLSEALHSYQDRAEKAGAIDCLVNLSIVRQMEGDFAEARHQIVTASMIAQEIGDPERISSCAVNQAEIEYKLGNYELGTILNERAGRIYTELDHPAGLTYYQENGSQMHLVSADFEAALELLHKAFDIAQEKKLKRRSVELLRQRSSVYYFQGDYRNCIQGLEQAFQLAEEMKLEQAHCRLKLGFVYLGLGDLALALQSWTAAMAIEPETGTVEMMFWKSAARGFIASLQGSDIESGKHQETMRSIAGNARYPYLITASLLLSAYQLDMLGKSGDALIYAEEAHKSSIEFAQPLWQTRSLWKILDLRSKQNLPLDQGVEALLHMARKQGQNEIVFRCFQLLRRAGRLNGEFEEQENKHLQSWLPNIPVQYREHFTSRHQ